MFDWKNPLFRFGVCATAGWLIAGVVIFGFAGDWSQSLKPNEWGDVFAGLFAPVAFLWLVLGFVQQGQELQLSTKALMLQVDELKNAVKHQSELVEVSREQVNASRRQEALAMEQERRAAQPHLVLVQAGSSRTGNQIQYKFQLRNAGATAVEVAVHAEERIVYRIATLSRDEEKRFDVPFHPLPERPVRFSIRFCDVNGVGGQATFVGTPVGGGMQMDREAEGG